MSAKSIERAYELARERYAEIGVDAEAALERLSATSLSIHCWQGDDVTGWETHDEATSLGGTAPIGAYPGRARTPEELRADLAQAFARIPGRHRVNLQSHYYETGGVKIGRDAIEPRHYHGWRDWAKAMGLAGVDLAPAYYSHPMFRDGFSLAHPDRSVREYWIEHGKRCRRAAADLAGAFGAPCLVNYWAPDGFKDTPVDRLAPRRRLAESLDATMAERIDPSLVVDAVESKLFGLGSESYVVGSNEFCLGYAASRRIAVTLDTGHFHPTEQVADKISALLLFTDRLSFHVSRGVRWDSDHVVVLNDETLAIAQELVRDDFLGRVHLGLDYFDASINRVAAWIIGARSVQKALLRALLEPTERLRGMENEFRLTERLAWLEEIKALPWSCVWNMFCARNGVDAGWQWLEGVKAYESRALAGRK